MQVQAPISLPWSFKNQLYHEGNLIPLKQITIGWPWGERIKEEKEKEREKEIKIGGMIKDSIGTQYKLKLKSPINVWS